MNLETQADSAFAEELFTVNLTPSKLKEFWRKVGKSGPDDCWLWKGSKLPTGYGKLSLKKSVSVYAHRISLFLSIGPFPNRLYACHSCDTPSCCNPKHLSAGTGSDNLWDASRKGRMPKGPKHFTKTNPEKIIRGSARAHSKLTEEQVSEILNTPRTRSSGRRLAEKFKVHPVTISKILCGVKWKHLNSQLISTPQKIQE